MLQIELLNTRLSGDGEITWNPSNGDGVDLTTVTGSLLNDYVPFYSAFKADFKSIGDKNFSIYSLPNSSVYGINSNRVADFKNAISYWCQKHGYRKAEHVYMTMKQCIWIHEGNRETNPKKIMYCLGFKSDYLFKESPDFNNLDYSKMMIFINKDFESSEHRLMYNFVKKEIITPLVDLGIDVLVTNSIEKWMFKSASEPVHLPTLSARREFLTNLTNETIDGITGRERPREIEAPNSGSRILDEQSRSGILGELEQSSGGSQDRGDGVTDVSGETEVALRESEATRSGEEVHRAVEDFIGESADAEAISRRIDEILAGTTYSTSDIEVSVNGGEFVPAQSEGPYPTPPAPIRLSPRRTGFTNAAGTRLSDEMLAGIFSGGRSSANSGNTGGDGNTGEETQNS